MRDLPDTRVDGPRAVGDSPRSYAEAFRAWGETIGAFVSLARCADPRACAPDALCAGCARHEVRDAR